MEDQLFLEYINQELQYYKEYNEYYDYDDYSIGETIEYTTAE
jgi:hypothetical protein